MLVGMILNFFIKKIDLSFMDKKNTQEMKLTKNDH